MCDCGPSNKHSTIATPLQNVFLSPRETSHLRLNLEHEKDTKKPLTNGSA